MKMPKIDIKLKISPAIMIYFGENKIGEITFKNMEEMGEFMGSLKESIKCLIEKYNKKEVKNDKSIN